MRFLPLQEPHQFYGPKGLLEIIKLCNKDFTFLIGIFVKDIGQGF